MYKLLLSLICCQKDDDYYTIEQDCLVLKETFPIALLFANDTDTSSFYDHIDYE